MRRWALILAATVLLTTEARAASFCYPAAAFSPLETASASCAPTVQDGDTTDDDKHQRYTSFDCDGTTSEGMAMLFFWPTTNPATLTPTVWWRSAATSGDVVWQVDGVCAADGGVITDVTFGTAQTDAETAQGTATFANSSVFGTAVTFANSAANVPCYVRILRLPGDAGDTMSGDAQFLGVCLTEP